MIKNQHHQREIEAKLEKGIINNDSKSIYSTGLTLQNKLIDDEKLMLFLKDQFANDSNTNINDNYQALIAKIRNNPKLLFEIIPSSKEKIDEKVKMQEKIKKSKILAQRAMKLKQKIRYFTNIKIVLFFRQGNSSPGLTVSGMSPGIESDNIVQNVSEYRPMTTENRSKLAKLSHI